MRYLEFKNKFNTLPLIIARDIAIFKKDKQALLNQLRRWQNNGLIIKLKRGLYILNENDRKVTPSRQFLANQLYAPSYISLEYALNFYGLIPERVSAVTSATTKKTTHFLNTLGDFVYQHIKAEAFRGFKAAKEAGGLTFFIAEPEKAVVDFLYLNLDKIKASDMDVFENSYRFQNTEDLKPKRITELASLFGNKKLTRLAKLFCAFIRKEKRR